MIISQVTGGLGNQLFQYATGRALALRSSQSLALDVTALQRDPSRSYSLDNFNINASTIEQKWKRPPKFKAGRQQQIANLILRPLGIAPRIIEPNMGFQPEILTIKSKAYLSGFWQCERYFIDQHDALREELALRAPLSKPRQSMAQQINNTNAVSVHIRRGDYISSQATNDAFGTCSLEWYHEAMRRIAKHDKTVVFFVFSDDPSWVRENIKSSNPIVFIDPQSDNRDCEDIYLMSQCRSHIISNSTFSWWGAWLNSRAEKHVIAPALWFRSSYLNGSDIVPETWERL